MADDDNVVNFRPRQADGSVPPPPPLPPGPPPLPPADPPTAPEPEAVPADGGELLPAMPGVETMSPPLPVPVLPPLDLGDAEGSVFVPPAPEDPENPTARDAAATALAVMVALSVAAANHLWQVGAVLRARAKQRRAAADKGVLSSGPGRGRTGGAGSGPSGRGRSGGGGSRPSGGRAKSPTTGGRAATGSGKPAGPSKGFSGLLGGSGSSRPGKKASGKAGKSGGASKGGSKGPGSKGSGSKGTKAPGAKGTTKGGTKNGAGKPRSGRTAGKGPGGAAAGRKQLGQRPGPKQLTAGAKSTKGAGPKGAGGRRQDDKRPGGRRSSGAGGRASFGGSQWWRRKQAEWRARRPDPQAGQSWAGTRWAWPPPPNWQDGMRPPPAADKTVRIRVERMDQDPPRRPALNRPRPALPAGGGHTTTQGAQMSTPVPRAKPSTQYGDAELTIYDVIDADADMAAEILAGADEAHRTAEGCDRLFRRLEALHAEIVDLKVPGVLEGLVLLLMDKTGTVKARALGIASKLPAAAEAISVAGTNAETRHRPLADAVRDAGHTRPAERDYHNE